MTQKLDSPEGARSDRYARQRSLSEVGSSGQRHLLESTVAVVGLGALGSVASDQLARAGVGRLILIDRDCLELTNLQRQSLYTEADALAGRSKAEAAAERLTGSNSDVEITAVPEELTRLNALRLLRGCDLVIDGTDNSYARRVLNDAAVKLGIPWVHGAATATYGVVIPFLPGGQPCYHCYRPIEGSGGGCALTGVLAATTHIVASQQVAEAMKLLITGEANRGILYIDPWYGVQQRMDLPGDPACPICGSGSASPRHAPGDAAELPPRVEELCGDETIRLRPERPRGLSLDSLRSALPEGSLLAASDSVLRFRAEEAEVTLFSDGRALIRGARGRERAQAIYREYVGG